MSTPGRDEFRSGGQTYETPQRPKISVPQPNIGRSPWTKADELLATGAEPFVVVVSHRGFYNAHEVTGRPEIFVESDAKVFAQRLRNQYTALGCPDLADAVQVVSVR